MSIHPAAGSTIIQIGAAVLVSTLAKAGRVRNGVGATIGSALTRRPR